MIKPLRKQLRYRMDSNGHRIPLTKKEQNKWLKTNPFLNDDFFFILMNRGVSEDFIRRVLNLYGLPPYKDQKFEFGNYYYWNEISEQFIRQFKNIFTRDDWGCICSQQNMSKDFIREMNKQFNDYCWGGLCARQLLSNSFIRQNKDKVNWMTLLKRGLITKQMIKEIADVKN